MRRQAPFDRCTRRWLSGRLRAQIMLRQDGRCADCGTRLILGFFVFDHRPPLALRADAEDAQVHPRQPDKVVEVSHPQRLSRAGVDGLEKGDQLRDRALGRHLRLSSPGVDASRP